MNKEEILYEKAGLIYTEHPKVIEAMTEFAKQYHKEQLILSGVVLQSEHLIQSCSVCGTHKHPVLVSQCKASNCPNEH